MYEPLHYDRPQPRYLRWILAALVLGLVAAMVTTGIGQQFASGQTQGDTGPSKGRQISLRQQLTKGLKATTKGDKAFINTVVVAVDQGRLPRKLVDSTFLWARQRADRRSYSRSLRPMVYFQPGLTLRAKRLGIRL